MIIWRLIGIILQVIGNILKRSNILFLGYYLASTGKTRSLPVYVHDIVRDEFRPYHLWSDTYVPHVFYGTILYSTIGKAWVRLDNNIIYIKDKYIFYPTCEHSDIHFDDCTCISKTYADLTRLIYIPGKIVEFLCNTPVRDFTKHITLGKYIRIRLDVEHIEYVISDKFWVNKGKPFKVYCEIPIWNI